MQMDSSPNTTSQPHPPQSKERPAKPAVLITGATTGIGKACALYLAQTGFKVFAGYRHPKAREPLSGLSPLIQPVQLDVTEESSIEAALNTVRTHLNGGPLYGLINNAGIVISGPIEAVGLSQWKQQLEVNLLGQIAVIQACLPLLRQSRGRIVNIGSVAGIQALPFLAPYAVSKFGLAAVSDALRVELHPWGIEVCLIEAGSVQTPIWEKSRHALQSDSARWPAEHRALYGTAMQKVESAALNAAQNGVSAQRVANAVFHALTAKRPRTRYAIGQDARLRRLFSWLPDRLKDAIIHARLERF